MTDTPHTRSHSRQKSPEQTQPVPRILLAWDAPNMDMALSEILGDKPEPKQRPVWWRMGIWLNERAVDQDAIADAVVFVNVPEGAAERMRPWIEAVRRAGFAVFVKPKRGDSDIDDDIASWIAEQRAKHVVSEVLIASGDRRAFQQLLEQIQQAGTSVAFLGFTEFAGATTSVPFIDLESIPGLFAQPLPRTRLDNLPDDGTLLSPLGRLGHRPPESPAARKAAQVNPADVDALAAKAKVTLADVLTTRYPQASTEGVDFSLVWDALSRKHPQLTARLGKEKSAEAFEMLAEGLPWHVERNPDGVARVLPDVDAAA